MATITPAHWYCPRCRGKDLYRAPRQVGSFGLGRAFDGFDSDSDAESIGFSQRSLEMQVWLCRNCGERAVYQKQIKHLTPEEEESSDKNFGILMFAFALLFFVVGITSANSVRDTNQNVPGLAWFGIIAGLVFGGFGFLGFSSARSRKPDNFTFRSLSSPSEPNNSSSSEPTDSGSSEPNKICPKCKAMRPARVDAGGCVRVDCPGYI